MVTQAQFVKLLRTPRGGMVNRTNLEMQAEAARAIAHHHALIPARVLEWAVDHNVDLINRGMSLVRNRWLVCDIVNDNTDFTS